MGARELQSVDVNGLRIAYREAGQGPAVLLVHGWPTSSYLWRNVMPAVAGRHRVVALDLPGFGASDKPTDIRYDFAFFDAVLDGFLDAVGIRDQVALGVHDLGGPLALHWAARNPDRLSALALFNTLAYPELGEEVIEFARTLLDPARRDELTTPKYLEEAMRLGVADPERITPEVAEAVTAPFRTPEARLALALAGCGLRRPGLAEIAKWLPTVRVPVRVVYGKHDRLLPDVAHTMARVAADVPHADVTVLGDCGHFVQEDAPQRVGSMLASFLAVAASR
jgi:haloalkane dehalogenase